MPKKVADLHCTVGSGCKRVLRTRLINLCGGGNVQLQSRVQDGGRVMKPPPVAA